nr:hypothetical protein [Tanacetum cinerariifolium]
MHTVCGDGVTCIKRRHRDLSGDGVKNLATASGRGRFKEDLESSTWRRRTPRYWLKFNNRDFSLDSQKEFRNNYKGLLSKEIEGPEALDYAEFSTLQEGRAFQDLEQLCHVSFMHDDRTFTSQAWNMLFRIREQVVREYVLEFLSSFKFRDHVVELDIDDTIVFQLEGTRRSMSMRQFILALGLYTKEEMNNSLFGLFRDACFRNRPNSYNPTDYCIGITTQNHYDSRYPSSYTTIKTPIHCLVHMLLTLSVACRHNANEKVTLKDLFFLHSMDSGEMVDVPWNMAKLYSDKAKGYKKKIMIDGAHLIERIARSYGLMSSAYIRIVTLGQETSLLNTEKLVELGICKFNTLGMGELVDDRLDNSKDEAVAAEAKGTREEE